MEAQFLTPVARPQIVADALTITCDPEDRCGRMSLLIRDGRIADIASDSTALRVEHDDVEVFDAHGFLVVPAFANAHFHPESLLFEDIVRSVPYGLWKLDPVFQKRMERIMDASFLESLKTVYTVSAMHHLRAGVLTVGHIVPPLTLDELVPFLDQERALHLRVRTVLRTWEQIAHGKELKSTGNHIAVSIGDDTDYTVYSLDNLARSAHDLDVPICLHLGELKEEAEILRRNFKKGLLTILQDAKLLHPSTQIAHLNHGSPDDLKIVADAQMILSVCPSSAALKRTGYPLLRHLEQYRVPLCFGTDWGSGDLLDEMRFMQGLPFLFSNLPEYSSLELLKMATVHGAKALGFGEHTGSIERGKQADLVFFSLQPFHMEYVRENPSADDLARLLLARMHSSDIAQVMASGRTVFEQGRCLGIDEAAIVSQFRDLFVSLPGAAKRVEWESSRATIIPFMTPVPSKVTPEDGYEEGFTIMRPSTPVAAPASPSPTSVKSITPPEPTPPQPERKIHKPELSKNVRLNFGDDDDGSA